MKSTIKSLAIIGAGILTVVSTMSCSSVDKTKKEQKKPNILWVMIEDWGGQLSFYGEPGTDMMKPPIIIDHIEKATAKFKMNQKKKGNTAENNFTYKPDWEQIRGHYKTPEWFRDAKFGIFLHWGVYSVPAYCSEKYPKVMYYQNKSFKGYDVYNYHKKNYRDQKTFGYKDFVPMFKAEKFDADRWVKLFKDAGAKYIVPVAEHHDAFAMYRSHFTRWNSVDMGPHKDILGLLEKATHKAGLKFGASSHLANWAHYFVHKPEFDTSDPANADLYWRADESKVHLSQKFLTTWWNRTTDIIDHYNLDLLWFDFKLDQADFAPYHKKMLSYFYNNGLKRGKEVVFEDKNMKYHSFPNDLIVLDLERGGMDSIAAYPWQTDTSIGKESWGYTTTEKYKSSNSLVDALIDIVSKNGCLLLNVGPKSDGTIPKSAKNILKNMGNWLKINGEAVYNTRPWKIYGEGLTQFKSGNHSEGLNKNFTSADIRFTVAKDNISDDIEMSSSPSLIYATALDWGETGTFKIKSLAKGNKYESRPIKSVEFISGSNSIKWEQTVNGLIINVEGNKPCDYAYCFKIKF